MEADDQQPDPKLLWRWAGAAVRPWAGWAFIGVGSLLVLLGYLGVSREAIVEKQVPYLVSGGIGGVLLCIVGAYFLATEQLRKDTDRINRLERMVEELHGALLERPDAPTAEVPTAGPAGNGHVIAIEDGETFHQLGCPMAEGKPVSAMTTAAATKRGLKPCPLCEPATATA